MFGGSDCGAEHVEGDVQNCSDPLCEYTYVPAAGMDTPGGAGLFTFGAAPGTAVAGASVPSAGGVVPVVALGTPGEAAAVGP
jgi:hypothetical protein